MGDLAELDKMLNDAIKHVPQVKRQLVEKAGDIMEQKVKANLSQHKDTGESLEAVTKTIGSGGGYAAVRNDYKKCKTIHLLENGYEVKPRGPNKSNTNARKNYKPSTNSQSGTDYVKGYHCYRNALIDSEEEIVQEAKDVADEIAREFNG